MKTRTELNELFEQNKINLYEMIASEDVYKSKCMQLASNSLDELIELSKANGISTVYYEYFHYNKEAYHMDEEEFDDISDEVMAVINEDIQEYNSLMETMDYSKPYILKVFCNIGSLTIFASIVDDWLTDQGIMPANEKLGELLDTHESTLNEIFENREERMNILFDELTEFIKNDDEFYKCTNATFRRNYMYDLAEREETQKFIEVIEDDEGYINRKIQMLIEELWRDYRLSKKRLDEE